MHKYVLHNCIELTISDEDWKYLCENRWFTDTPDFDDVSAEFGSGTGITPNKPQFWDRATEMFHEYVNDLRDIQQIDINSECKKLKRTFPTISPQSIMLAKQARLELQRNGYVTVICPKCQEHPEIMMTSKGERTIITCPCGYVKNIEINF